MDIDNILKQEVKVGDIIISQEDVYLIIRDRDDNDRYKYKLLSLKSIDVIDGYSSLDRILEKYNIARVIKSDELVLSIKG